MLSKRVIPCLDVAGGRVVKGVQFKNLVPMGDAVELARAYASQGADELMFLDITATTEKRATMVELVEKVGSSLFIPFAVGGGITSVDDVGVLLRAGADKVSVNTAAVQRPPLITELARAFGSQCIVISMDVLKREQGWQVTTHGGTRVTDIPAMVWAREVVQLGAGEILLNVIDADGMQGGYALDITREIADAVSIPVIASGGAGEPQHLYDVLTDGHADAVLAASIFHQGKWTVDSVKRYLASRGLPIRL